MRSLCPLGNSFFVIIGTHGQNGGNPSQRNTGTEWSLSSFCGLTDRGPVAGRPRRGRAESSTLNTERAGLWQGLQELPVLGRCPRTRVNEPDWPEPSHWTSRTLTWESQGQIPRLGGLWATQTSQAYDYTTCLMRLMGHPGWLSLHSPSAYFHPYRSHPQSTPLHSSTHSWPPQRGVVGLERRSSPPHLVGLPRAGLVSLSPPAVAGHGTHVKAQTGVGQDFGDQGVCPKTRVAEAPGLRAGS